VALETSGHTGPPRTWLRAPEQLAAEIELIGGLLIGDVDEVVCFAPTRHLFGRLFGAALPAARRIPVQHMDRQPLAAPALRPGSRVLFVCLPASWLMLRGLVPAIRRLDAAVLLHGAGPAPPVTSQVVAQLAGTPVRAVELFGSTETGGVAHRDLSASGGRRWTLLPDVDLLPDPEQPGPGLPPAASRWEHQPGVGRLHVRSPRLARPADMPTTPESILLNDVVRRVGPRQFEFLGRSSRLIKINGIRCDLDAIERVAQLLLRRPVACVAVRDAVRGEHYELFCEAAEMGPQPDTGQVWQALAPLSHRRMLPRRVHVVAEIPVTVTGKVDTGQLGALAETDGEAGLP
jgi:acyl-coenzyme A synthetase/AMP-(fatty) acid ligase